MKPQAKRIIIKSALLILGLLLVPFTLQARDSLANLRNDLNNLSLQVSNIQHTGATYRWAVWSSYSQASSWYGNNDPNLFGGVSPSQWGDGNATADQMSADKEVLRTLFNRKGYAGKNAVIVADEWNSYSSTNSKHAAVLFRIRNTTSSDIVWPVSTTQTAYPGWGEKASIAINGNLQWESGSAILNPSTIQTNNILISPGINTIIFVSSSANPGAGNMRSLFLSFRNDSLELPVGLEYIDDLDTASGGWDQ